MIFTDRTITVRKGESRIDEPIVVYRGDYELEVRFTILNSRFKFMSGANMIESEKASYGQLAILTPYGGNIFSDIVRCNDGSVTFVLTAEMLNQIEEVGLYSFQIRLMDYNKESRVSIPPIEFGIEVREPIASEDHDNSVNNAIVGYSIAKVVDPKEENVGDTFDEDGNYNKTKWETGDRISEGKLNKIEDAIDKVNRNEMNNITALTKRIDSNFNVLDSIKADETYVDTKINAVASGSPRGVYSSMSTLKSSIPNGDANIYITTDNGNWNYWDGSSWVAGGLYQSVGLEDGIVKPTHINGGITNNNLFKVEHLQVGYIYAPTHTIRENKEPYRYFKTPIESETSYIIARDIVGISDDLKSHLGTYDILMFLDEQDNVIKSVGAPDYLRYLDDNGIGYIVVKTPMNSKYICMNAKIEDYDVAREDGVYILLADEKIVDNVEIDKKAGITRIFNQNIVDEYARYLINTHNDNITNCSNNIVNSNTMEIIPDKLVDTNGNISNTSGWYYGRISVKPNTTYCIYFKSGVYTVARGSIYFEDSAKKKISAVSYNGRVVYSIGDGEGYIKTTTPTECHYLCLTLKSSEDYHTKYDDRESVVITEEQISKEDIYNFIKEIDGARVFTPWDLDSYIHIPVMEYATNSLISTGKKHKNALYNNNGNFSMAEGWACVDIPANPNSTYYFYSPSGLYSAGQRGCIVLLDGAGVIKQSIEGQGSDLFIDDIGREWQIINTKSDTYFIGITVSAPDNRYADLEKGILLDYEPSSNDTVGMKICKIDGAYIEASYLSNELLRTLTYSKVLSGKKWVVVGDSLTEFNNRATKNYHDYVAEDTGVTVINFGRSGSGYKKREENNIAFYQRILNIPTDADIVTIFGSGNDLSLTLGTPSDTGTDTICGCIHQTIQNLFSVNPGVRVGIVLPCPWGDFPPSVADNKMALYCDALKEIAGQYSIPVLDLYHGSNLRPWDATFRDLYYKRDGGNTVHPDEDGHALLANKFKMFIQSL